jgi:hypothetical protein
MWPRAVILTRAWRHIPRFVAYRLIKEIIDCSTTVVAAKVKSIDVLCGLKVRTCTYSKSMSDSSNNKSEYSQQKLAHLSGFLRVKRSYKSKRQQ